MRTVTASTLAVLAGLGLAVSGGAAFAANADQPHSNVDHRNDAGNGTGNSQVDRLNGAQLPGSYHGQNPVPPPAAPASPPPAAAGPQR